MWILLLLILTSTLTGCATSTAGLPVEPASGTPDAFLVVDGSEIRAARPGEGCRSPMADPRDDARLMLIRSTSNVGDYEVPAGSYGVGPRSLLRIDCLTGGVIGIVRR